MKKTVFLALIVYLSFLEVRLDIFGMHQALGVVAAVGLLVLPGLGLVLVLTGMGKRRREFAMVGIALIFSSPLSFLTAHEIGRAKDVSSMHRGDEVSLALQQFHNERGQYPQKLSELVPGYLEQIPITTQGVFVDIPFEYWPTDLENYSLGFLATTSSFCQRNREGRWIEGAW